jgi:hypothetical protein
MFSWSVKLLSVFAKNYPPYSVDLVVYVIKYELYTSRLAVSVNRILQNDI